MSGALEPTKSGAWLQTIRRLARRAPRLTLVEGFGYAGSMKKLRSLWRGELSLGEAFWTWAIGAGLLVNVTTSALFLSLLTVDRPLAALLVGYGLSVPYNVVAVVGVWRSAERYPGPSSHADLARAVTTMVMLLLTIT